MSGCMLVPCKQRQDEDSYKDPTILTRGHSLGIPGMDLASVHHPGQFLIKFASKLAQTFW